MLKKENESNVSSDYEINKRTNVIENLFVVRTKWCAKPSQLWSL